ESDAAVRQKIIGLLTGAGVDAALTQDSKYALQSYLQSKEPSVSNQSGSITVYSEFYEWLTALTATHTTTTLSASQWTADYLVVHAKPSQPA
ncbi:hypothetical protein, partial [Limnohabitans sp.]|uniref:hypothetical protein n=1 Tax=Limnohabitans sp. TaxID=1907725 RepID=UPI00286F6282